MTVTAPAVDGTVSDSPSRTVPDTVTALAAAVGPDRTANKDQPYQYSKSALDDSGRAVGGAGLQSRAGLTTLENYYPLEETIQLNEMSYSATGW